MKRSSSRRRTILIGLVLLVFSMPAHARLPRSMDTRPYSEQTHFFRAILHEIGIKPTTALQSLGEDSAHKILIVLGPANLDRLFQGDALRRFLDEGGAVMIASDRALSDDIALQVGARIEGTAIQAHPEDCYRGTLVDCPLVREHRRRGSRHPIFHEIPDNAVIATNRPSRIPVWSPTLAPLASIGHPGQSFRDFFGGRLRQFNGSVLAMTGDLPTGGRLLVVADHSLFINGMMLQPDNDNIQFAFGIARWLSEDGKRTEALVLDNGAVQPDFQSMLIHPPPPALPPLEAIVPKINQFIRGLEKENVVNKMILQAVPHATLMRSAHFAGTLALLMFGIVRFLHTRHRVDARPIASRTVRAPTPVVNRSREAARELAVETWNELGQTVGPDDAAPWIAVRGGWWTRRTWRRRIDWLWSVAAGADGPETPQELPRLHEELLELRAAVAWGVVHFPPAP